MHGAVRQLANVRLLLVEPHDDTRALYRLALRDAGAEVRTASNVADAIAILRTWDASILVSDVALPGTGGCALVQAARALHGRQEMIAIAVTAHASARTREEAYAAGFEEYLVKPLGPRELVEVVVRCMESSLSTSRVRRKRRDSSP